MAGAWSILSAICAIWWASRSMACSGRLARPASSSTRLESRLSRSITSLPGRSWATSSICKARESMRFSMRSKTSWSSALACAATVEATMAREISSSLSSIMPSVWLPRVSCWLAKWSTAVASVRTLSSSERSDSDSGRLLTALLICSSRPVSAARPGSSERLRWSASTRSSKALQRRSKSSQRRSPACRARPSPAPAPAAAC